MNSTPTPGPWFVVWEEEGDDDVGGYGTYMASEIVSGAPDSCDYVDLLGRKNAALVAAAPEMLSALQYCAEHWDWLTADVLAEMRKRVNDAIARATERPPGP